METNGGIKMKVNLVNQRLNKSKQCKVGLSWTVLFFNGWVPLLRGDWKWTLILICFSYMSEHFAEISTLTFSFNNNWNSYITFNYFGIISLLMLFYYNRIYINGLLRAGYVPLDEESLKLLEQKGFFDSRFGKFYWSWIESLASIIIFASWIYLGGNEYSVVIILGVISLLIFCLFRYVNIGMLINEQDIVDEVDTLETQTFFKRMIQVMVAITTSNFQKVTRRDLKSFRRVLLTVTSFIIILAILVILVTIIPYLIK